LSRNSDEATAHDGISVRPMIRRSAWQWLQTACT
jgi:hypothetical protein